MPRITAYYEAAEKTRLRASMRPGRYAPDNAVRRAVLRGVAAASMRPGRYAPDNQALDALRAQPIQLQ